MLHYLSFVYFEECMIITVICCRYVHSDCDETIDNALLSRLKDTGQADYVCTVCRAQDDVSVIISHLLAIINLTLTT